MVLSLLRWNSSSSVQQINPYIAQKILTFILRYQNEIYSCIFFEVSKKLWIHLLRLQAAWIVPYGRWEHDTSEAPQYWFSGVWSKMNHFIRLSEFAVRGYSYVTCPRTVSYAWSHSGFLQRCLFHQSASIPDWLYTESGFTRMLLYLSRCALNYFSCDGFGWSPIRTEETKIWDAIIELGKFTINWLWHTLAHKNELIAAWLLLRLIHFFHSRTFDWIEGAISDSNHVAYLCIFGSCSTLFG